MTITNQTLMWLAPVGGAAVMTVTTLVTNYFDTHRPVKVVSAGQGRKETVEEQGVSDRKEADRMFGIKPAAADQSPTSDDITKLRRAIEELAESVAEAGPPQSPSSR